MSLFYWDEREDTDAVFGTAITPTSLENSGPMTIVSTAELEALRANTEFLRPITVCERCSGTEDAITSCIHCCRIPGHEDTCACKVCLWVRAYYELENVLIKDRAKVKAGEQDTVRLARIESLLRECIDAHDDNNCHSTANLFRTTLAAMKEPQ